jgi:hypothetical protein
MPVELPAHPNSAAEEQQRISDAVPLGPAFTVLD